ncbi:hypothetical protein E6O75_ATG02082 [Venturia nashicola]|uniref:Uncharacterized protein n=1 Tax=Venturia nashicola TaxID=86259 RepID=A0A4Z1P5I0_9PEZI|nr:hypothetical protein E6O75_ATG02082 [Venturia nashicola]
MVFYHLALTQIKETEYFNEEDDVVIPKDVLKEHTIEAGERDEKSKSWSSKRHEAKSGEKVAVTGQLTASTYDPEFIRQVEQQTGT